MTPILYENDEMSFTSNGLCRLRDCISCIVTEERNGIYECDFEYPANGANYELIQVGRIITVTHDDLNDVQPFDIVSRSKPIDGIVTFHCTHVSYRLSYATYRNGKVRQLDSLAKAFNDFNYYNGILVTPTVPFTFETDKTSTGYLACNDGVPRSIRQMLGGIEGSILDIYGGEYEWDRWRVILHNSRGVQRSFTIRYGVNMLTYTDELDASEAYKYGLPFWTDGETTVVGSVSDSGGVTPANHDETVPLDLSDRFENQPTLTALQNESDAYMGGSGSYLPTQTINVSFARLQDMAGYEDFRNLEQCELCDTIKVIFPDYDTNGYFKIVKTVWNVLEDKYDEMQLGSLSTTLTEALGITETPLASSGGGGNVFDDLTVNNDLTVGNDVDVTGDLDVDNITAGGSISSTGDITSSGNITASGHIQGAVDAKGAITGETITDKSIASGATWKNLGSVTLPTGLWIIYLTVQFATNATGNRQISVASSSAAAGTVIQQRRTPAASGTQTTVGLDVPVTGGTWYFNCQHNAGSSLTVSTRYTAIRIGNSVNYL